ncbi:MAG: hypothetical protein JETT_0422 [Candidatus Jettenia ecosi]|uniref:Uncharacterized protein n=1 Tax=Candidatus Jettenia ecosi TaxID=2494326 RepID=A0A533QER5_9BACT|nr:MAG: hypothetical protein JETT_0422 [Candidatus Jettenia ecosi]
MKGEEKRRRRLPYNLVSIPYRFNERRIMPIINRGESRFQFLIGSMKD